MIYSYYLTHFHGTKGAHYKGVRALRGYFAPPPPLRGQKIKDALHKFLLISLLEQLDGWVRMGLLPH